MSQRLWFGNSAPYFRRDGAPCLPSSRGLFSLIRAQCSARCDAYTLDKWRSLRGSPTFPRRAPLGCHWYSAPKRAAPSSYSSTWLPWHAYPIPMRPRVRLKPPWQRTGGINPRDGTVGTRERRRLVESFRKPFFFSHPLRYDGFVPEGIGSANTVS